MGPGKTPHHFTISADVQSHSVCNYCLSCLKPTELCASTPAAPVLRTFVQHCYYNCIVQPTEAPCDVISGMFVDPTGLKVDVKLDESSDEQPQRTTPAYAGHHISGHFLSKKKSPQIVGLRPPMCWQIVNRHFTRTL